MAKGILVNRSIEDGEKLVEKLEEKEFPISAALWQTIEKSFPEEHTRWRLLIVSPVVDEEGPIRSYMRIGEATRELGDSVQFGISDISAIGPRWPEFQRLRRNLESEGVGRIKAEGRPGTPQGVVAGDFYVYRWNPDLASS